MNGGRAGLAWMLAALFAGALLAVVIVSWLPERSRSTHADSLAPSSNDSAPLASAIEKLDQRLARIEAALAVQDSRGTRESVPLAKGASPPAESGPSEVDLRLERIAQALDQLAKSIQEGRKPAFAMPTLAQIHGARRDVDWAFVDSVRALCLIDSSQALERVRLLTFDDLLRKVGVPSLIRVTDDGAWIYHHEVLGPDGLDNPGILLFFVGDSVTGVTQY